MAGKDIELDKAEIKKLLIRSKKEPVNCAVGEAENGQAIIQLHKVKAGRAVSAEMQKTFGAMKNLRWGTAEVDVDEDPKLVILVINRAAPGMARKLKKTLKGTSFSKVEIRLEDGTVADAVGEEDEEGGKEAEDVGATVAPVLPSQPAAPVLPSQPAIDPKALRDRLTVLAQQMVKVIGADPSRREALMAIAKRAQLGLSTNDLEAAEKSVDELEAALGEPSSSTPAPTAPPGSGPDAYTKSRLIWLGVRKKLETDLDTLRKHIVKSYKDEAIVGTLDARYAERVASIVSNLDETLADTLGMATNATDPGERGKLVAQSKETIKRYQAFVASEPLFKELDTNPFVPLAIAKTMDVTLATLAAAIR